METATVGSRARPWLADMRAGYLATLPLWVSAAPFGVVYAVSALAAGLSPAQTIAMSLLVFAGASQFTAVGMFGAGAAPLAVVLTTLVVNARHLIMSASLAPHMRGLGPWRRLLVASQLTDESYAMGMARYLEGRGSAAFLAGSNLSIYTVWGGSAVAGALLGRAIPDPAAYGLDLVFPLTFVGLLAPLLKDRAMRPAAAIAAALTVAGALLLPGSWYVLLAGVGASGLGAWLAGRRRAGAASPDPTPGGAP